MLAMLGGRAIPRLKMDDKRLAKALSEVVGDNLKGSDPFLGGVADKVEEIIEGRKGTPYARLSYDGSAPVEIEPSCRFVHVDLDVEVEGDTVLLLSDIIEEQFLREYPSDRSLAVCFSNQNESKLFICLYGMEGCVATQAEIEVTPYTWIEINIYSSPDGILYVVAGAPAGIIPVEAQTAAPIS